MSRAIKFRAWDNKGKCWIVFGGIYYRFEDKILDRADDDTLIYEQYTGLKDKNGKEIYEGDRVSIRNKNHKNEYDIGVVEFKKGAFRCPFLLGKYRSGQIEVIGNIHENPELLGGEV